MTKIDFSIIKYIKKSIAHIKISSNIISTPKAQAAMEYLMIAGFVMLIMLPLVYLVYNYTQESGADIVEAQINKLGRDIINNAESVYYFSSPSKITIDTNMPRGVLNITIHQNDPAIVSCIKCTELRFLVQQKDVKQTLAFSTNINMRTDIYDGVNTSKFNDSAFSEGLKHFNIQAKKDHVLIGMGR